MAGETANELGIVVCHLGVLGDGVDEDQKVGDSVNKNQLSRAVQPARSRRKRRLERSPSPRLTRGMTITVGIQTTKIPTCSAKVAGPPGSAMPRMLATCAIKLRAKPRPANHMIGMSSFNCLAAP